MTSEHDHAQQLRDAQPEHEAHALKRSEAIRRVLSSLHGVLSSSTRPAPAGDTWARTGRARRAWLGRDGLDGHRPARPSARPPAAAFLAVARAWLRRTVTARPARSPAHCHRLGELEPTCHPDRCRWTGWRPGLFRRRLTDCLLHHRRGHRRLAVAPAPLLQLRHPLASLRNHPGFPLQPRRLPNAVRCRRRRSTAVPSSWTTTSTPAHHPSVRPTYRRRLRRRHRRRRPARGRPGHPRPVTGRRAIRLRHRRLTLSRRRHALRRRLLSRRRHATRRYLARRRLGPFRLRRRPSCCQRPGERSTSSRRPC